jgi:hypothetical protein
MHHVRGIPQLQLDRSTAKYLLFDVECSNTVPTSPPIARLGMIAEDQWGLLTRQQAQLGATVGRATLERLTANSLLERVDHGVYRLTGAPIPDHMELRAAWLRLAPDVPRWQRTLEQGVVSHRSAAAMYGVGDLPADRHEFTVPSRRQSRRSDIRFHVRPRGPGPWIELRGLPVTRPSRIASDLLQDSADPEAVAHIVAQSIREVYDYPGTFAEALAPHAARFGLRRGDGLALLQWLLGLVGYPDTQLWLDEARRSLADDLDDEGTTGWSEPRSVTLGEDA